MQIFSPRVCRGIAQGLVYVFFCFPRWQHVVKENTPVCASTHTHKHACMHKGTEAMAQQSEHLTSLRPWLDSSGSHALFWSMVTRHEWCEYTYVQAHTQTYKIKSFKKTFLRQPAVILWVITQDVLLHKDILISTFMVIYLFTFYLLVYLISI